MAGELVTADYQCELRGLLMGATTNFGIGPRPAVIEGLGVPPLKTHDLELLDADGSYGGHDRRGVRLITVPLVIRGVGTSAAAMNKLTDLLNAWAPSTVDIPLYMRLPGWGRFSVQGRPRGCEPDIEWMQFGSIRTLCSFHALTPTITFG